MSPAGHLTAMVLKPGSAVSHGIGRAGIHSALPRIGRGRTPRSRPRPRRPCVVRPANSCRTCEATARVSIYEEPLQFGQVIAQLVGCKAHAPDLPASRWRGDRKSQSDPAALSCVLPVCLVATDPRAVGYRAGTSVSNAALA